METVMSNLSSDSKINNQRDAKALWYLLMSMHFIILPPGEHVPKKARKGFGFVVAERDVLHRVDSGGQPLQELEWLVFGDVGVVQDEGEFVAKNFHARKQFTQIVFVKLVLKFVKPTHARCHLLLEVGPPPHSHALRLGAFAAFADARADHIARQARCGQRGAAGASRSRL